jgi:hypothetical protein
VEESRSFLRGSYPSFYRAKVLLPMINLEKGLPQTRPRRGTVVPLLLPMDPVHGVEKRRSTGEVEEALASFPSMLHHPRRSLRECSYRRAALCRCFRGCRHPVEAAGRHGWRDTTFAFFLVVSFSKAQGMREEEWSWSSSSGGIPGKEAPPREEMSKCRSPCEAPPREGLACWSRVIF